MGEGRSCNEGLPFWDFLKKMIIRWSWPHGDDHMLMAMAIVMLGWWPGDKSKASQPHPTAIRNDVSIGSSVPLQVGVGLLSNHIQIPGFCRLWKKIVLWTNFSNSSWIVRVSPSLSILYIKNIQSKKGKHSFRKRIGTMNTSAISAAARRGLPTCRSQLNRFVEVGLTLALSLASKNEGFLKMGYPQITHFNWISHYKHRK